MTAPLAGRRILSCRPRDRASELHRALDRAGGTPVHLALIEIVPPADSGRELRNALAEIGRYDWIACTSTAGVAALAGVDRPPRLQVAAVGPATADAFAQLGWTVDLVATEPTAAGLAASFPPGPGRVLAPLAELAGDDLRDGLARRGFDVRVVTAYRSIEPEHTPEQLDQAAACDAVVLSSPSIVHRLTRLLGDQAPRRAVAYGPRSAAAARSAGFEVRQAATPTPDDIVATLAEWFTR